MGTGCTFLVTQQPIYIGLCPQIYSNIKNAEYLHERAYASTAKIIAYIIFINLVVT